MKNLVISPLIGDGMVFQSGVAVPVWGRALPGTWVSVKLDGEAHSAKVGPDGKWRVMLPSRDPGGPCELKVSAAGEKARFRDVHFGDVWICSGQSNMELQMQRLRDEYPEEWEAPVNQLVRQFKVPQQWEFSGPRDELSGGEWSVASGETLHGFSGTAWFFAKEMLQGRETAIGLVNAAWGGTPVEAWMSRDALSAFPEKLALGDRYDNASLRAEVSGKSGKAILDWYEKLSIVDRGLCEHWQEHQTSFAQWGRMRLPGDFSHAGLDGFSGVVWLRREFEVPPGFSERDSRLWLGTITDADTVFVNGTKVGETTYRYPPRKYDVPAGLLREGKNRIVMRVVCCRGDGGITEGKPFRIFSADECVELDGIWEYRVGARAAKPCPDEFFFQRLPGGLFNAMIAPMLDFPCRGIIWYQGESNDSNVGEYAKLFTSHVRDWQSKWKRTDCELPFVFVQLPIWHKPGENDESSSWAALREAQRSALSLPATAMAAGLDLGEWNDLHPLNKKAVGQRLAMAARRLILGEDNTSPGPLFREATVDGGRLLLRFDNCGKGLFACEQPHVTVIADGNRHRLPADIEGPNLLLIDVSGLSNPTDVFYAWADNPRDRQLSNAKGLPMIPFRARLG